MCYILGVCLSNQPPNFFLYGLTGTTFKQFTVMVAKGRKAAQIDPSYSPFGANVHPYLTDGSYGLREFVRPLSLNSISIGSSVFAELTRDTETHKDHATQSVAISRIYAMHAMRPKTEFITHDKLVLQTNRHSRLRHHSGNSVGHSGLCSDISSRPMNCRLQNHK